MITHRLPDVETYDGITVVRDLLPGGTKSRYIWQLFEQADEVVYASSAEGGAQVALAATAQRCGKRATIFGPARSIPHPRQLEVQRLGGTFVPVKPGYLNVVEARARQYAEQAGALLTPFGMAIPNATDVIAETACSLKLKPDFVWCAAGSGPLMTGLTMAFPNAERHAVQVGHALSTDDVAGAEIHISPHKYSYIAPESWCPFDACGTYERKAWRMLEAWRLDNTRRGTVLFWSPMTAAKP